MDRLQSLLRTIITAAKGTLHLPYTLPSSETPIILDFESPFAKIDIVPKLEECLGQTLPDLSKEGDPIRAICYALNNILTLPQ